MSYGLQVFSSSGSLMLDTDKGSFSVIEHFELPLNQTWSKSYPELAGYSLGFQVMRRGSVNFFIDWSYPVVNITYPGGVPTVNVTKGGSFDGYVFSIIIFITGGFSVQNAYGIDIFSSVDQVSLITEHSKLLRFRGAVLPSSIDAAGSHRLCTYHLGPAALNVIGVYEPEPFVLIELSPSCYVGINWTYIDPVTISEGLGWVITARVTSTSFTPRLYVFSNDSLTQPVTDNAYGITIAGSQGQEIYHSGRDFKPLQTVSSPYLALPAKYSNYLYNSSVPIPVTCAASYRTTQSPTGGPGYFTGLKLESNTVRVGWTYTGAYEYEFDMSGYVTFINTQSYL